MFTFITSRFLRPRILKVLAFTFVSFVCATHAYAATPHVGEVHLSDLQQGANAASSVRTLSVPEGVAENTYHFPTYTTPFAYNAIGIKLSGTIPQDSISGYITVISDNGTKTVYPIEMVGDDLRDDGTIVQASAPIITHSVKAFTLTLTLHVKHSIHPVVNDVNVIYLDSTISSTSILPDAHASQTAPTDATQDTPEETTDAYTYTTSDGYTVSSEPLYTVPYTSSVHVISRSEWGADESYRYTTDSTTGEQIEIWPTEYSQPQVFIVHHTSGSDGGDDPAATIRAIYYFHAVVYGWGDIGYNYIIDPAGNIYEGRAGGDAVIGGHAYNSQTHIGFNTGSVGIVLLGCYEDSSSACSTLNTPTEAMMTSLENLIEDKAHLFGIDVNEQIDFHGTEVYRLSGHRDVSATLCPGDLNYNYIPSVRADLATVDKSSLETRDAIITQAFITDSNGDTIQKSDLQVDTDYTLSITVLNTGQKRWLRKKTYLTVNNGESDSTPSLFASSLWPEADGHIKWDKGQKKTFTYQTVHFTIPFHTPATNPTDPDIHIHMYTHVKNETEVQDIGGIQSVFTE